MRLCTVQELTENTYQTCASGCQADARLVWTLDGECRPPSAPPSVPPPAAPPAPPPSPPPEPPPAFAMNQCGSADDMVYVGPVTLPTTYTVGADAYADGESSR